MRTADLTPTDDQETVTSVTIQCDRSALPARSLSTRRAPPIRAPLLRPLPRLAPAPVCRAPPAQKSPPITTWLLERAVSRASTSYPVTEFDLACPNTLHFCGLP